MYNIDKLFENIKAKGHVCVGLDTCADYVPPAQRRKEANDAMAVLSYNKALIDATCDIAACYKVQIAYYEEMGMKGLHAYSETLRYIRSKNCLIIADIKRGDIADTALRYSKAHFSGDFEADFVTLNPYMGMDSIQPWIDEALNTKTDRLKGAFVLMKTSNQGMKDFECLEINNDGNENDGKSRFVYDAVGKKMSDLALRYKGNYGYGMFGVVVGCPPAQQDEAAAIRKNYPDLFFLIPGYGAQGGGARDAAALLLNGNGGVVNASRSIVNAWQNKDNITNNVNPDSADNLSAAGAARQAVIKMRDEIFLELKTQKEA